MQLSDFNYQIYGSQGPWLIFLHGLMGAAHNWRRIVPDFEGQYRCLTLDQRGHGRSFKPEHGYAPEDFAQDLKFIMDELQISKAIIVGHSMGGRNALAFTYLYPERVIALVVEDIGPSASVNAGSKVVEILKKVPRVFESKLAAKEYLMNQFGNPRMGMFMYINILTNSEGKGVWAFNLDNMIEVIAQGRSKDRWEYVENIKVPTLIIRGEFSDELSPQEYQRILNSSPLISGVEIPGAGHWVHADKPNEFIEALKKFLPKFIAS